MLEKSKKLSCMNERGSILVIALVMLVFLTLIGVASTTTTEIEMQVAGNEKFHKIAFYNTDGGVYATPKLISISVEQEEQPATGDVIQFLDPGPSDFFDEVMGFRAQDTAKDIRFTMGDHSAEVDVVRVGQETLVGGGTEFAGSSEGVGGGTTGGVAIFYDIDSYGTGPASSQCNIYAGYRLVPGMSGGL
jgi:hypothetical protein